MTLTLYQFNLPHTFIFKGFPYYSEKIQTLGLFSFTVTKHKQKSRKKNTQIPGTTREDSLFCLPSLSTQTAFSGRPGVAKGPFLLNDKPNACMLCSLCACPFAHMDLLKTHTESVHALLFFSFRLEACISELLI